MRRPAGINTILLCCLTALLSSLVLQPSSARAQDDDVVRVNTDLVVLNITVTDKTGQYIPGLHLEDFAVFEDGKQVPAQMVATFQLQEAPFAAVVLLDTSGSMESRLSLARSAAIRFLDHLREEDMAAVYKFDSDIERVQEFSTSHDLAPLAFGMRANGMTRLNDAIIDAAKALSERQEKRKAIVVLSDGMDTRSSATTDKALDTALAIGATIYAVDMSSTERGRTVSQTAAVLKQFAEKSGGRFVATPGGPALREAFANIADELGHQYTLAYRPLNRTRDGKWRKLEVKLSKSDLVVRTRKAYRAPKS